MEPLSSKATEPFEGDLLILDTETTALGEGPDNEPIEISWKFLGETESEEEEYLLCPEVRCLPSCTVVHGITPKMLLEYPFIRLTLPEIWDRFASYPKGTVVSGYHVGYDIAVINNAFQKYLKKEFRPQRVLDVERLAKKLFKVQDLGNFRLDTVYYFLFPEKLGHLKKARQTHRAMVDVQLTEEVLGRLWEEAEEYSMGKLTLTELVNFAHDPIVLDTWPFGKCKGQLVRDVLRDSLDYVEWFMERCEFRDQWPDLVYTIKCLQAF
jgi:DNA polymerase III epsilon subunit-like protein